MNLKEFTLKRLQLQYYGNKKIITLRRKSTLKETLSIKWEASLQPDVSLRMSKSKKRYPHVLGLARWSVIFLFADSDVENSAKHISQQSFSEWPRGTREVWREHAFFNGYSYCMFTVHHGLGAHFSQTTCYKVAQNMNLTVRKAWPYSRKIK